jgi:hypothetical protein
MREFAGDAPPAAPSMTVAPPAVQSITSAVWTAAAGLPNSQGEVQRLSQQRRDLKRQADEAVRDLRNAEKKRARLIERARGLSDVDLVAILGTRAACKAKAKGKAKAKAKATTEAGAGDSDE